MHGKSRVRLQHLVTISTVFQVVDTTDRNMILQSGFYIVELEYVGAYRIQDTEEETCKERVCAQFANLKVVFITSSLHQIDYCCFLRKEKIFCLLSRESSRFEEVHRYCHIFTTSQVEQVDEVNENIKNALKAAHEANTVTPQRSTGSDNSHTKLTRSVTIGGITETIHKSLARPNSLSASFPDNSLRDQTTSGLKIETSNEPAASPTVSPDSCTEVSCNSGALRQLIKAKSSDVSLQVTDHRSHTDDLNSADEKTTLRKAMLKHTISAQARLEANKSRNTNLIKNSARKNKNHKRLSKQRASCPSISETISVTNDTCINQLNINNNHMSITVGYQGNLNAVPNRDNGSDNLAFVNDEKSHDNMIVSLPPPSAFSDPMLCSGQDDTDRRNSYNDVFKDYIDFDRKSLNNNNPETMSFYSANYIKTDSLSSKLSPGSQISPTSHVIDRTQKVRQSLISSGSSGISVNSIENELAGGQGLPISHSDIIINRGAVTPLRYQNDSPFRQSPSAANGTKRRMSQSQHINDNTEAKLVDILRQVPWYQPKMTRNQVMETLSKEDLGAFIIRESTTHNNCFALSVKVPKFNNSTGVAHYIIYRKETGEFKIKGLEKEWPNLSALVTHHTIMPELLPCTLKVPHPVMAHRHGSTASRGSNSSQTSRISASSGSQSPVSTYATPDQNDLLRNQTPRLTNNFNNIQLTEAV